MSHLAPEAMRRVLAGEGGTLEVEGAAEHFLSCERCRGLAAARADELRAEGRLAAEGPLRLVLDVIDRERQWAVQSLAAIAEWAEVRRLPSRRSQRDRVRMTKSCHSVAFLDLVLGELRVESSWDEAEFLAGLALLSIEAMSHRRLITLARANDLQAEVWTAVANSRRRAAEWKRAHQALANAERYLKEGSGDPRVEAGLLAIVASTLADEGQVPQALGALERCRAIYEKLAEPALLARALVKTANVLEPLQPAQGLLALDRAQPLIPAEDSYLRLLAELLRVECLIGIGNPGEALRVFRRCSPMFVTNPSPRMRIRGKFIGAKLLEAIGQGPQAEKLFNEVVDRDVEHELYKDAFLDLLYLYGHHMKAGSLEKAACVCRRALTDSALSEVAHEQMRSLWEQLLTAAQRHAFRDELLKDLRQYLSTHWKHPAIKPPIVACR